MPEIELKLTHADPAVLLAAFDDAALVQAAVDTAHTIRMHSQYCDTPDHALRAAGCTLRFRAENDAGVVALKTEAAGHAPKDGLSVRGEFEVPAASLAEGLAALKALAPDYADLLTEAEHRLCLTASVTFTRLERHAAFGDTLIAFSVDRGYFNGDESCTFAEFEAELKRGDTETLLAVCDRLTADYGLVPLEESKLRRALACRG